MAFLKADGTVWATGLNKYGELGNGTSRNALTPVQVSNLSGAIAVSTGTDSFSSYALKSDGTVWAWGYNGNGQLGNGTKTNSTTPVQVSNLTGVVAIASDGADGFALKSDGTVWAWGDNTYGQLGNGTTTSSATPVQVSNLTGIIKLAVGSESVLALKSDGTVWGWGDNSVGELGNGTNADQYDTPIQVPGLTSITSIATGDYFSIALTSSGTMWVWGVDGQGEFGAGSSFVPNGSVNPVQVPNFSGVTAVAANSATSLALKSDGTVWASGYNGEGQLGNGTTTNASTPVQASGLAAAVAISEGDFDSYAVKSDGTAWAWGFNKDGELGNGATKSASTPVQVTALSGLVTSRPGASTTYTYDGDGLRASSTATGGQTQQYAWNVAGANPTLLTDGSTSYIYDDNGLPVEQIDSSGNVLYYHHDQLGSTRVLTNSTGAVAATYSYDANGNLTSHTGTADTPLRWAGQYQDPSGLYYMQARYYDPTSSQFITVDPLLSQTQQPYSYANDNPLNETDPSGFGVLDSVGNFLGGIPSDLATAGKATAHFVGNNWRPIVGGVADVATAGTCIATVGTGCSAAIGLNVAAQSALVATGSGSVGHKLALISANMIFAGGGLVVAQAGSYFSELEALEGESTLPSWVEPYVTATGTAPYLGATAAQLSQYPWELCW